MGAGAGGLAAPLGAGACGFGGGLRGAETVMVGRGVAPDFSGLAAGVGVAGAGASPAGCGTGVAAAGGSFGGEGCGEGDGGVSAQALTLSDEIRNDVDASNRGRNDIDTPR